MFIRSIVVKHLVDITHIIFVISWHVLIGTVASMLMMHLEVRLTRSAHELVLTDTTISLVLSLCHCGLTSTHDFTSLKNDALRIVRRLPDSRAVHSDLASRGCVISFLSPLENVHD